MNKLLQEIVQRCEKAPRKAVDENTSSTRKTGRAKGIKAAGKAKAYGDVQTQYATNRKSLAKTIVDEKEGDAKCELDPELVGETYKGRFGGWRVAERRFDQIPKSGEPGGKREVACANFL